MAVSVIPTLDLERAIAEQGYDVIVGFDEVGRGSLAGPVMVGAAAIWARDLDGPAGASQGGSQESSHLEVPKGVADSKMLTEHKREAIFDELKSWCASWAVGAASNKEIDEWGISHALGVAALRALAQAEAKLGIDGNGMLSGKPVKVGAILDGPNDYITKTLNTFDAPEVPVPANVTTKVKGDRNAPRFLFITGITQGNPHTLLRLFYFCGKITAHIKYRQSSPHIHFYCNYIGCNARNRSTVNL